MKTALTLGVLVGAYALIGFGKVVRHIAEVMDTLNDLEVDIDS